jgi:hypothetical protein
MEVLVEVAIGAMGLGIGWAAARLALMGVLNATFGRRS